MFCSHLPHRVNGSMTTSLDPTWRSVLGPGLTQDNEDEPQAVGVASPNAAHDVADSKDSEASTPGNSAPTKHRRTKHDNAQSNLLLYLACVDGNDCCSAKNIGNRRRSLRRRLQLMTRILGKSGEPSSEDKATARKRLFSPDDLSRDLGRHEAQQFIKILKHLHEQADATGDNVDFRFVKRQFKLRQQRQENLPTDN